jgi:triacylglycerol lipase
MDYSLVMLRLGLGSLSAFTIAVVGYVVGSFALMHPHADRRPFLATAREALREMFWAMLIVPLVPLFYFVGRRMGAGSGQVPVVLVHGYTQNRANFLRVARALVRSDVGPIYGFNYPWMGCVTANADRLARFVEEVLAETGAARVDLVCHSLGGLVAVEYLTREDARVRRCVTVASPHAGVAWRGPILGRCRTQLRRGCDFLLERAGRILAIPCLSIFSTHDNVVHPHPTSSLAARGGRDFVVKDVGHLTILFDAAVVSQIVGFLGCERVSVPSGILPDAAAR